MSLKITVDVNVHFSPETLQFFSSLFSKAKAAEPTIPDAISAAEYDENLPPAPVKKPSAKVLLNKKTAPPVTPAEDDNFEQPAPKTAPKKRAPRKKADPADPADEEFTIDALRKLCAQKARAGFREEIRETLDSFGVDTLDDLPEEQYAEFAQEIAALE